MKYSVTLFVAVCAFTALIGCSKKETGRPVTTDNPRCVCSCT